MCENIYGLIQSATRKLNDKARSDEMKKRINDNAQSYDEALDIIAEYITEED